MMKSIKQMFMRKRSVADAGQTGRYLYQQRLASCLQQRFEKLGARSKKMVLIGVLLFMGAYAIGLIAGGIGYNFPELGQISRPTISDGNGRISTRQAQQSILRFREIMDSLSTTSSGRRLRDSILGQHPGILDTIAELELLMEPINK